MYRVLGERRGVSRVLLWTPKRKRDVGRPRCRWENTIKMVLQEVGCRGSTESSWLRLGTDGVHL